MEYPKLYSTQPTELQVMPLDVAIYAQEPDADNADMDSLLAVSMYLYLKNRSKKDTIQAGKMLQR